MKSVVLDPSRDRGFPDPKVQSKKTHIEKFISLIPVPYYLGWFLLAFAFLLISYLALLQYEKSLRNIDVYFVISVIIALEGIAINWAHKRIKSFKEVLINIVELPEDVIIKSYEKQEADIFNDKRLIIFSIVFIIFVHVSGIDYHAISFNSSISNVIFKFGYYFAVYLEGVGLCILIMTALAVHKIGMLPLQVDALFSDFQAIGILYSKFTIFAASVYIVWGFFHIIVPPQFSSMQMIFWFLGFAVFLFAYFILPQYNIHRMMTSTKKEKIEMFSSQLRAALDESLGAPTQENASYLKDMFLVQNQLNQMCEWPFGIHEIIYIVLIIVIPLIIVLLEIVFGIII
jgi:hypothetical protein